jgi:hypothetical protein
MKEGCDQLQFPQQRRALVHAVLWRHQIPVISVAVSVAVAIIAAV